MTIRGSEEEKYVVVHIAKPGQPVASAKILEEVEISRALFELYDGAVASHSTSIPSFFGTNLIFCSVSPPGTYFYCWLSAFRLLVVI